MQGWQAGLRTVSALPFAAFALVALPAIAVGCGGQDSNQVAAGGRGGGGGSGGVAAGGAGGSTQPSAGSAGKSGGGAGGTAGSGGGSSGPPVPRVDNTEGESVLDVPNLGFGGEDAKCAAAEVFCNGMCVAAELQTAGNCTVLKLGLNQTADIALTADALYYTAANQEILKLDLAQGTHTSLVRGLTFVKGLAVDGDWLYFSTDTPDGVFSHDTRRIALAGGDVTVISPEWSEPVETIIPLADKLLLGVGNFDYELHTIPKAGGESLPFGGITRATSLVLGDSMLYYRSDDGICATSITAPMPEQTLNNEFSNARLILEGGYLYYALEDLYMRQPIAGGAPAQVQPLVDMGVWGRSPTQVILTQVDPADEKVTHVLAMPIAGGTPQELLTIESNELQDVAADATHLYLAVGLFGAGAILRVPF